MRGLMIAIALVGLAWAGSTSAEAARGARYCLKNSPGPGDCKYSSYRQCMASASGTSAICVRNYGPRR
jgi:hypothetical protein